MGSDKKKVIVLDNNLHRYLVDFPDSVKENDYIYVKDAGGNWLKRKFFKITENNLLMCKSLTNPKEAWSWPYGWSLTKPNK